jgi:hypothetical protein
MMTPFATSKVMAGQSGKQRINIFAMDVQINYKRSELSSM